MSGESPTRSRLIALKEERRAMQEGYVFLDEKCLLLAGAMLAELHRHGTLAAAFARAQRVAAQALHAALLRHGLDGLTVYPAPRGALLEVKITHRALLGVELREASARAIDSSSPAVTSMPPAVYPSPEAETCRHAFGELAAAATALAATAGNLARLSHEYRRTVRRASALHDVVLPELDHELREIDGRLEELEREEALWIHHRPQNLEHAS